MQSIVKKYLITVASLFLLTQLISSFSITGSWSGLFFASFILFLLLYVVRPILNIFMFPLNLVTLNLSSWILYILIFFIWTLITSYVKIDSWNFPGLYIGPVTLSSLNLVKWQVTIVAAIILQIATTVFNWILE